MNALAPLLSLPLVDRTRRNHGLEHATITLLTQRERGLSMAGRSTPYGFYLYGHISTDQVAEAAAEALRRMRAGEHSLAIHPNCGTNFVVAGFAAALAAFFGFYGARNWRDRLERVPFVASLSTLALIFAQPAGLILQRDVTTSGHMGEMEIISITRTTLAGLAVPVHYVATQG